MNEYARAAAARLGRWITRVDRWNTLCDNLTATRGTDAEGAAFAAWEKGRRSMPGKTSKHRAYDDGNVLAREFGRPRPSTVEDLRALRVEARMRLNGTFHG